jgi:hypothetical protein
MKAEKIKELARQAKIVTKNKKNLRLVSNKYNQERPQSNSFNYKNSVRGLGYTHVTRPGRFTLYVMANLLLLGDFK